MTALGTTLNVGIFLGPGIHADRPTDALGGALYVCTTHGIIYKYDLTAGWEDWATITGGGPGSLALDDLTDVDLTTTPPVLNNRLVYDGTNWVAAGGSGSVAATDVAVMPAGNISSTDAQSALEELDDAIAQQAEVLMIAVSDEATAITTGTAKVTFRMPFAMTLTAVRASLTTASSSGTPTVDINEGGVTILSTKLTIDATEKTSTTAAAAAVISDTSLADDAEITIDIDTAGTGAKGLKVTLIGTRT